MEIITSPEFQNKLSRINKQSCYFINEMLINNDLVDNTEYPAEYFQFLYARYFNKRITVEEVTRDLGLVCGFEPPTSFDSKISGYLINLNKIKKAFIKYVEEQIKEEDYVNKLREMHNFILMENKRANFKEILRNMIDNL